MGCNQVDVANAIVARIAQALPISGVLRQLESAEAFPAITCVLRCAACDVAIAGAIDLSGELGPTDGPSAVHSLLESLGQRGCTHAAGAISRFCEDR